MHTFLNVNKKVNKLLCTFVNAFARFGENVGASTVVSEEFLLNYQMIDPFLSVYQKAHIAKSKQHDYTLPPSSVGDSVSLYKHLIYYIKKRSS